MSATDPDEPIGGHRFIFSLAPEAAGKANFSVRDNKGTVLVHLAVHSFSHDSAVNGCSVIRQHGLDSDPEEQLQQPAEERLPRSCGHFRRRASRTEQHQHAHHPSVHLRPRGQHEAVQP